MDMKLHANTKVFRYPQFSLPPSVADDDGSFGHSARANDTEGTTRRKCVVAPSRATNCTVRVTVVVVDDPFVVARR
ncbi:hypothetical protein EVAR_100567_1 [Eumeta japonica]|uniref:Uncharacterized protein n=1 Tax=Eumeta variegata TaxID=151549 RepID=A0A4C1YED2_EUMVA|nr:hypothetical protein EVAR_100567_1 [Eumeta japonica]